eukprot:TRINITY_DN1543_c0_g1_i2.p1 TRINITY_DN1543_c0_g1~~TRINITY_DN1543_c0_g1_i2.p1  ORF type:complete len:444 (+),score=74.63 TRINITY_DN1543_c0_g1_i2:32-1333(+)
MGGGGRWDQNTCKVQLKLATSRLKLQKNKKDNQIKDSKREVAELLRVGKDESARIKVEGVIREDFIIEAYEILELFCELILARLGVIQISKQCPPDLREAVCTIIYAAPRAEVKELLNIRDLLIAKFGKELAMEAVHNKDNCVNARIVHKLSIQTPENYLVYQYLAEIAKAHNLDWKANFAVEPPTASLQPPPQQLQPQSSASHPIFPDPPSARYSTATVPQYSNPPPQYSNPPHSPDIPTFNPKAMPNFPSFPNQGTVNPNSNFNSGFPDFPSPPGNRSGGFPDFPSPPGQSGGKFPEFPSTPGQSGSTFPDFPSAPAASNGNLPSPPTTHGNSQGFPDFPAAPTNGSGGDFPDFPEPPKDSGRLPDFPSPPTTQKDNFPEFPTPPKGGNSDLDGFPSFPSPPSSGGSKNDSSVPDFDELTARFEKLKKRDV